MSVKASSITRPLLSVLRSNNLSNWVLEKLGICAKSNSSAVSGLNTLKKLSLNVIASFLGYAPKPPLVTLML